MSRKTDLEESIRESYSIIAGYEEILRFSNRPEEKLRGRSVMDEQWGLIAEYEAEYLGLAGERIPGDIREILARLRLHVHRAARPKSRRLVPSLLPYLPDRDEQEFALDAILDRWRTLRSRPLVCIVHGNESQCEDMFLERIKRVSMPKLLELEPDATTITEYSLKWPRKLDDARWICEKLGQNLADSVLGRRGDVSVEQINRALALHPGPVVIHAHLLTKDWQRAGPQILHCFLQFWQNWPDLLPGQRMFVFLCVKYVLKRDLGLWRRLQFERLNEKMSRYLETTAFSEFDRVVCAVLPELGDVLRSEAEEWARLKAVEPFCARQQLIDAIQQTYAEWERRETSEAMPMEYLARALGNALRGALDVGG